MLRVFLSGPLVNLLGRAEDLLLSLLLPPPPILLAMSLGLSSSATVFAEEEEQMKGSDIPIQEQVILDLPRSQFFFPPDGIFD